MNWDAIGAVAELLGAFGVLATLGYLTVQIRQNTSALRGTSHETGAERLNTALFALSSNPQLAQLVGKGGRDYEALSYDERLQVGSYWSAVFVGAEVSLLQFRRGNLDENVWQRDWSTLKPWLHTPGVREWYERNAIQFTPEFQAMIEREVGQAEAAAG